MDPTLRRVFIHTYMRYFKATVWLCRLQSAVRRWTGTAGQESYDCLGPRMDLCVSNSPMAEAPHQNLHIGAVREFHLATTFEFSVHRENMVVKWLLYHSKHKDTSHTESLSLEMLCSFKLILSTYGAVSQN